MSGLVSVLVTKREGVLILLDVFSQCCSTCFHSSFLLLRTSPVAWLLFAAPLVVALVAAVMVAMAAGQETSFSCQDRPYGYYADVEADCQVFHICNNNAKWSFRCPNQTLFNQQYLVCDYQANVDCGVAASLYTINDNFGRVEEVEDDTESPAE
uniref:Chitin-binding type-2 domain-containing protein n=1 Tax=Scylla olivacea TaxID=85551 RepID=A0A0P4WT81_SCYOL